MRSIFYSLILIGIAYSTKFIDRGDPFARLFQQPSVPIRSMTGYCSGVFIRKDVVITARHCLPEIARTGFPLPWTIDGKFTFATAKSGGRGVSFNANFYDSYALLRVDRARRDIKPARIGRSTYGLPLLLKCYPVKGGKPILRRNIKFRYNQTRIQGGGVIITNPPTEGGCSGGGLFNVFGELVGITIWGVPTQMGLTSVFYDLTKYAFELNR